MRRGKKEQVMTLRTSPSTAVTTSFNLIYFRNHRHLPDLTQPTILPQFPIQNSTQTHFNKQYHISTPISNASRKKYS